MSEHQPRPVREARLQAAFSGIRLTDRDLVLIHWLSNWEQETTDALIDLVERQTAAAASV